MILRFAINQKIQINLIQYFGHFIRKSILQHRTIKYIKEMNMLTLSPSTKDKMDSVITPIIDIIHKNKIRSYHQMIYEQGSNLEITKRKNKYIFPDKPKTALQFHCPRELNFKNQPIYSVKTVRASSRIQSQQKRCMGNNERAKREIQITQQALQNNVAAKSNKKRKFKSLYSNSTIKKHLIDNIDFQQIQKILYKKSESVTRYEYFLLRRQMKKQLKQKINLTSQNSRVEQANKYIQDKSELCIAINEQNQNYNIFKIKTPPKKKFWLHEQIKPKSNRKESKVLEGKKYETIN